MLLPTLAFRVKAFTALSITSIPCCLTASADTSLKKLPRARTPFALIWKNENQSYYFWITMVKQHILFGLGTQLTLSLSSDAVTLACSKSNKIEHGTSSHPSDL